MEGIYAIYQGLMILAGIVIGLIILFIGVPMAFMSDSILAKISAGSFVLMVLSMIVLAFMPPPKHQGHPDSHGYKGRH